MLFKVDPAKPPQNSKLFSCLSFVCFKYISGDGITN